LDEVVDEAPQFVLSQRQMSAKKSLQSQQSQKSTVKKADLVHMNSQLSKASSKKATPNQFLRK